MLASNLDTPEPRGLDQAALRRSIRSKLVYAVGRDPAEATAAEWFEATALAVRDRLVDRNLAARQRLGQARPKHVHYLSMEFLIGRLLADSLAGLGLADSCRAALADLGVDLAVVLRAEPEPALGNGGLGRLAACFLDSMASLGVPGYGYGIRYQYGLFRQRFEDGWQVEEPDDWRPSGNPFEIARPDLACPIGFGGRVEVVEGADGRLQHRWHPDRRLRAVAHDLLILGHGGGTVDTLRLWSAEAAAPFDLGRFQRGDHQGAVEDTTLAQTLTRVLYPDDSNAAGRELRLQQEFFFTSASLQDLLRRHLRAGGEPANLADAAAIQLNDTHPAIAVAELLRLLIDDQGLAFDEAFEIGRACIAYTNHTLMPEALERWPVELLERLLPRHMQLIRELDARFTEQVRAQAVEVDPAAVAVIDQAAAAVRMGNLAFVGSHRVNGVSALHTELMRQTVFRDLDACLPGRIVNQTNGITPRRWLAGCNPALAQLIDQTIGRGWRTDLEQLEALVPQAEDAGFRQAFALAKRDNKDRLAALIEARTGVRVDPAALFDVQIKRLHEYKRQLMNVLEAIALHQAIRAEPDADWPARVKIFGGKAAPSYHRAKLIIKLANDVGRTIAADPLVGDRLQLVFMPDYHVSLAEAIVPAADLSEQISTAGMEASGTGNMKLALNGALTIGTLDGANVEMRARVGAEHFFIFGLQAEEVAARQADPGFSGLAVIEADPRLQAVIEALGNGSYAPDDPGRFQPLIDDLQGRDPFMVTADFAAYWRAQRAVDRAWGDRDRWWRSAVLNTARMGWFSADRTIRGYASEIWGIPPAARASTPT